MYLKNSSSSNNSPMPNVKIKTPVYKETIDDNPNPSFEVLLVDFKKNQLAINKSTIGEEIYFKTSKNKRINVYNSKKQYIGQILTKDYKQFSLIANNPEYFEGEIFSFNNEVFGIKKVIISIQAKVEYSKTIYQLNKNYLNTLITLNSLFEKEQIIETNYGPATVVEIYENHLLVEVPSLGNREIYDIESLIK